MAIFEGAGVAMVTPFMENGKVNYEELGKMIEHQIANKTDSIVICGSTGETATLSHEEHIECIRQAVAFTKGRVPIIAGTGSNCTETAIYLSQEAQKCGTDGVLVVSPYYNKGTQKGMMQHFKMVADSIDIPMILYNIPGRTGVNLKPATIATLVKEVDNIVGVKSSVDDLSEVVELMSLCNGEIDVYSGDDALIVPYLSIGAKGVISVLSNVVPEETHELAASYLSGNVSRSLELQLRYLPLIRALFSEVNPIPVKKALHLMGCATKIMRMPLTEMEPETTMVLLQEMKKVGLL